MQIKQKEIQQQQQRQQQPARRLENGQPHLVLESIDELESTWKEVAWTASCVHVPLA